VTARVYTTRLYCAEPGCRETGFSESSTRREEAETLEWYRKHPYRCYRHSAPDEVLSVTNLETIAVLTAQEHRYTDRRGQERVSPGLYWGISPEKATNGSVSGPGFRAICNDFPAGTRLIVTARIELPDTPDCPPGCTKPCCQPTEATREALERLDGTVDDGGPL
jgi:hypothetical protein